MDIEVFVFVLLTELVIFYFFVKALLKVNVSQELAIGPKFQFGRRL